jgi:HEAT repeat protein
VKLQTFKKTRSTFAICGLIVILSPAVCYAQADAAKAWTLLKTGVRQKSTTQRLTAVRVLGLIPDNPQASALAEKSLHDPRTSVRAAAATALGQMHASGANAALKQALQDKELPVVMAAAHALRLLNDPACYEVYYEVLTGERKDDSGMVTQELKVLHDPKQVAEMGFNEGIGYVPFAGIGWEALQTIMKDRKDGAAAKAALISALATDPDARTNKVLVDASQNQNWVLRVAALESIAKRGDPSLLPRIEKALGDSKPEVKYSGAAAIVHLSDVAKAHQAAPKSGLTTH